MSLANAHILICRTDNIGDVVLTLPVAGYLKQRYPGVRIGFLCRSYAAPLVRCCEAIDYVLESDRLDQPAEHFAQSGIDTIIFSKPDKKLAAAAKKARIPNRVGTSHRLFHWLYCNRLAHFSRVKSDLHEAQLNFALLRPLGFDFMPARKQIPALYRLVAPATPPLALASGRFHLIFHPKSNGNGREWPIAHYTELARLLSAHADIAIWITGSAGEQAWLEQHGAALLALPNVQSVCGKFALDGLAAFIEGADGLIASGTGPVHMSAALGKPTLGLFPPKKPIHPGRWAPLGEKAEVLCEEKTCAGCSDAASCACMRKITPAQVEEIVLRWRREKADS